MDLIVNNLGIIIYATLLFTPPLLFAAMGSCFSELSGVVNIGIEGMMTIGAFVGAATGHYTGNPWLSFICGGLAGMLFGALHALATVKLNADQTISGTAINFLAPGVAVLMAKALFNSSDTAPLDSSSKIPTLFADAFTGGSVWDNFMKNVFSTYATTYLVFVVLVIVWFVFYKTRYGLRLRACGEHPQAADSVGINVYKMRYAGVLISGALGAIGGMAYIVPPVQTWNFEVGVAGAGFLALAVMIFGQWKPFHIFGAAMFFAVFKSLANIADSTFLANLGWSSNIYNMMPFIASMIILAFTSKNSMAPKAEGIPYDKGSR